MKVRKKATKATKMRTDKRKQINELKKRAEASPFMQETYRLNSRLGLGHDRTKITRCVRRVVDSIIGKNKN